MNEEEKKRYKNSIDTSSLLEHDAFVPSAEDIVEGDLQFAYLLIALKSDRHKFIALALFQGWNQTEIAQILGVRQQHISNEVIKIRKELIKHNIRHNRNRP